MSLRTRALGLASLAALVVVGAAQPAQADPKLDHLFDNVALEARGFSGAAPGFGTGFLNGGDLRLVVEGAHFGFLVGARLGAAGTREYLGPYHARPRAEQLVALDVGGRGFLDPRARLGLFLGGGLTYGQTEVDGAFVNADLFGAYGELGLELPRTSPIRLIGALRFDVANAATARYSRVPGDGLFGMITLNVGFVLGGERTGCYPHP